MTDRADALMVASRCARVAVERLSDDHVREILTAAGAPMDLSRSDLIRVLRVWAASSLLGLAEVLEGLALLDDVAWTGIKAKLDSEAR
jgi:hypothetical protein